MIVRDEESNLEECILPIKNLVEEIVIVDTGSRDKTRDIARRFGARVLDFPWCDDFAAARNEALKHASKGWILSLDADDRVSERAVRELRALFATFSDECAAYTVDVVSIGPADTETIRSQSVRVFRNSPQHRWTYRVHEQIAPSIKGHGGKIEVTDITIRHDGYRDTAHALRKQERNLRLLDLSLEKAPLDPHLLLNRGTALLDLRRPSEAIVSLNLCRAFVDVQEGLASRLFPLLVEAYELDGDAAAARLAAEEGGALAFDDIGLTFVTAELLVKMGDLTAAETLLNRILDTSADNRLTVDLSVRSFRARHLRGEIRLVRGDYASAELDARAVTTACAQFAYGWLLLGEALLAQGKEVQLEELVDQLGSKPESKSLQSVMRISRCTYEGSPEIAREQLAAMAPPRREEQDFFHALRRRIENQPAGKVPVVACLSKNWRDRNLEVS